MVLTLADFDTAGLDVLLSALDHGGEQRAGWRYGDLCVGGGHAGRLGHARHARRWQPGVRQRVVHLSHPVCHGVEHDAVQ